MNREKSNAKRRRRRLQRVRKKVQGDAARPRLSVFRSHRHIYVQAVDDEAGRTLCAFSSRALSGYGGTIEHARKVGEEIASRLVAQQIKKVRFDRGPYRFHGRVKALAESARKKGLEF